MHIFPERPGFHPSPPNRWPQTCRAQLWSKKKCLKLQFSWLLQMNPLYVPLSPFPSFLEFNFQKYIMPLCNLLQTLGRKHSRFGPLSRCPFPASILVHPDFVSLWASPPAEAQVNTACLWLHERPCFGFLRQFSEQLSPVGPSCLLRTHTWTEHRGFLLTWAGFPTLFLRIMWTFTMPLAACHCHVLYRSSC